MVPSRSLFDSRFFTLVSTFPSSSVLSADFLRNVGLLGAVTFFDWKKLNLRGAPPALRPMVGLSDADDGDKRDDAGDGDDDEEDGVRGPDARAG